MRRRVRPRHIALVALSHYTLRAASWSGVVPPVSMSSSQSAQSPGLPPSFLTRSSQRPFTWRASVYVTPVSAAASSPIGWASLQLTHCAWRQTRPLTVTDTDWPAGADGGGTVGTAVSGVVPPVSTLSSARPQPPGVPSLLAIRSYHAPPTRRASV